MSPQPPQLLDIESVIKTLSLADKVKLLAGKDFWHFEDVPSAGIPAVRCSDGPNGVRGQRFFNGTPASCFPCATGLAASFDYELVEEIGKALGDECRAKGAHVLLGPTVNIQRSPLGGRGFESFSEDPHLSGMLASAYINGVQSKGVSACIKHFVANDQEYERFSADSIVAPRALREIYLEPFRLAYKNSKPAAIMSSYNKVNGVHASESDPLLDGILRKEWGFDGLVMSDWTGTYSVDAAVRAGLDVEMPGPPTMRGAALIRQVSSGKLPVKYINDRVRAVLGLVNKAIASGIPFDAPEAAIDTSELRALLRKAATSALVLLKNKASILPIAPSTKSIAVIGSNAKISVPSGGGSASLLGTYTVSPLEGIKEAGEAIGATVEYASGASAFRYLPLLDPLMKNAKVEVFKTSSGVWYEDVQTALGKADWETETGSSLAFMIDGVPWKELGKDPLTRFTATFTPDISGTWEFGLASIGGSTLFVNKTKVVDNVVNFKSGELFFNMGSEEVRGDIRLEAGKVYEIEVRQSLQLIGAVASPFLRAAAIRLGAYPKETVEEARNAAVELARKSDLAVVIVGTNPDWESEGHDRKHIFLPGESDQLVAAVLAANKNTIVVTQSGTPVAMPWLHDAPAVVHAFFGGNELGNGLADVLFGKVNPSGKLPLTFPKRLEDNPSFHSFGITVETPGKVVYGEGIYVGYRHYQKSNIVPLFPFGHGLSYTSFKFTSLQLSPIATDGSLAVSFKVDNVGKVAGSEIAQVYISAPRSGVIPTPVQELVGFEKVFLKAGETKEVSVTLYKKAFSYWDENKEGWAAKAGVYKVLVGGSLEGDLLVAETKLESSFASAKL